MGAGAQGGHMGRFNTIPEKEDGGRGLEWAWMKRWKEWGFSFPPLPPQAPPFPRGWAPARKPADSGVLTAGGGDSAAICY